MNYIKVLDTLELKKEAAKITLKIQETENII